MRDAPLLHAIHILYFMVKLELGRWISISKEGKSVKSRYCMQSEMNTLFRSFQLVSLAALQSSSDVLLR